MREIGSETYVAVFPDPVQRKAIVRYAEVAADNARNESKGMSEEKVRLVPAPEASQTGSRKNQDARN
jgi:hypothetical protein